jgi:hypothetical protein
MTVAATDDRDTVSRGDDTLYPDHLRGPRSDFDLTATVPNLFALKPDIAAPGTGIRSAARVLEGSPAPYATLSGTSQASPAVAGAAAVLLEARPELTALSVKELLLSNADSSRNSPVYPAVHPTWDDARGSGMLNLFDALQAVPDVDIGFPSCVGPPPDSPGTPCALSGRPSWENVTDIFTDTPPLPETDNWITARVENPSPLPVTVLVNFGVYDFATGNRRFFDLGTQRATIPAATVVNVRHPWRPLRFEHQCLQVSIGYGRDADHDNNITQRNYWIRPSTYKLRVENPLFVPARFEVKTRSERPGWRCEVDRGSFTIDPFQDCPAELLLSFHPAPDARPGQRGICRVAVFATPLEGQDTAPRRIGGMSVETFVPEPCRVMGTLTMRDGKPVPDALLWIGARSARTDRDGVFSLRLTPFVEQSVTISSKGEKKASTSFRPECGIGGLSLILDNDGITVVQQQPHSERRSVVTAPAPAVSDPTAGKTR